MDWLRKFFSEKVGPKLEAPAVEIVIHLVVSVLSVVSIAIIELLLKVCGLDWKPIPIVGIALGEWMFFLEVVAATLVIGIGIVKAVNAMWK